MKTDPTDTGGLFVGRRPGTRPVRYRELPKGASRRRQRIDAAVAGLLLALQVLVNLTFWGPLPAAWLWVGSQVDYQTGSVMLGITVAFVGMTLSLLAGLMILRRLDAAWILVRRAAGHDQREGVITKVFVITCGIGTTLFVGWLLLFSGARLTGGGIG